MFDDNPSTENLCEQFENLKVAPTTVYKFMTKTMPLIVKEGLSLSSREKCA